MTPSHPADPASALKGPRLNYVLGNLGVVNLSGYFLLSGDIAFLLPFSSRLDLGLSVEVWQRGAAHRLPWAGTEV